MMNKLARAALLLAAALPLAAQIPFDNSGNNLLNGTYYFREVVQVVGDSAGDLSESFAFYGNITFDGNGNYAIPGGQAIDCTTSCQTGGLSASGKYVLSASGFGYMTSPAVSSDTTYILFSQGVLIGSATEPAGPNSGGFNEMIIGAPVASPLPGNSSFNGSYTGVGFLPGTSGLSGGSAYNTSVSFALNPNGAGSLGSVGVTGYFAGATAVQNQAYNNVKYNFNNGAAIVTFPVSSNSLFFSGQEYLYFSPDGNFFFGGSPNGFDMLVGIRNPASGASPQLSGLYYAAGLDFDAASLASGYGYLDTYYGSFSASAGTAVEADRLLDTLNTTPSSTSTYTASYPAAISSGSYTDSIGTKYWLNSTGSIRIGSGVFPYLNLSVALKAPSFVTTAINGPYIYPNGVTNSASAAPFTAGIANGELITIYGSGLASSTVVATSAPFPTTLGNVQVLMNSVPAPIYYVSPTQISVIAPSANPFSVEKIQVINNGALSNAVTQFVRTTDPGVFTLTANGLGYAAAVHNSTGKVVTPTNPAQPGEYVQLYLTGLGPVYPTSPDGAPGPVSPLSLAVNTPSVYLTNSQGSTQATGQYFFAGLAPTLAGLYQINFQIPAGLTAGDYSLTVYGPDSSTAQALLSIGSGTPVSQSEAPPTVAAALARRAPAASHSPAFVPRPAPNFFASRSAAASE